MRSITGSFRIATVKGIPLQVHWSFALLILVVLYHGYTYNMTWGEMGLNALLILALFLCVVMHEFGHAFAALRYGIKTHDVTILPIGGVARLDRIPERPMQELVVAIAGPLVNVAIALVLFSVKYISLSETPDSIIEFIKNPYLSHFQTIRFIGLLAEANLLLVVFNLIPAFPMDGGRVLRALLAMQWGRLKATRVASVVGQILAVGFVGYGLWQSDYVITFIGAFVYMNASREFSMVKLDATLQKFTLEDIPSQRQYILNEDSLMSEALHWYQLGIDRNFLVYNADQLFIGMIEEVDILHYRNNPIANKNLEGFINMKPLVLNSDTSVSVVIKSMMSLNENAIVVAEDGIPTRTLDLSQIEHFAKMLKNGKNV